MKNLFLKRWLKKGCASLMLAGLFVGEASASTSSQLPFASAMTKLKDAISGPFLLSAAIIMIVTTCLMLAFGEFGDGFKKIINIVLWLSIAFAATSFVTTMFGAGAVF